MPTTLSHQGENKHSYGYGGASRCQPYSADDIDKWEFEWDIVQQLRLTTYLFGNRDGWNSKSMLWYIHLASTPDG